MPRTIQLLIDEANYIIGLFNKTTQISETIILENHYRKILLLSCASLYEKKIIDILKNLVKRDTSNEIIIEFVTNTALERKYHTYFNWNDVQNINSFLGLFGKDFKDRVSKQIDDDSTLKSQMQAFLAIGSERNRLVHGNFLVYNLSKTFTEIVDLHKKADEFITFLEGNL